MCQFLHPESAFGSPVFQRNFRPSKTSRPPPMSWISTFRVEVSGTPKAPKSFSVGNFSKNGGGKWVTYLLDLVEVGVPHPQKFVFGFCTWLPQKNGCRCSFPKWLPFFQKEKGLWSVDSFYCNTYKNPQKISTFSCSWYFWNTHESFCVKDWHRWRCFFWTTSKHWGLWNLMFFDSLRIKDAVWGWGSRQLGHSMKQDLHEPFVSTTKTLGILECWTFFLFDP